jgi:hypothetical protein
MTHTTGREIHPTPQAMECIMKTITSLVCVLILPVLLLFSGCSEDESNPTPPNTTSVIWPLVIGNTWIMQNYALNPITGQLVLGEPDTTVVSTDTTIQGVKWYILRASGADPGYATNKTDGYWVIDEQMVPRLMLKYPVQVNDSYPVIQTSGGSNDTSLITVTSVNQSVTVPAGTFTCVTYRMTDAANTMVVTYHLEPNKGPIRMIMEIKNPQTGLMMTMSKSELQSRTLK